MMQPTRWDWLARCRTTRHHRNWWSRSPYRANPKRPGRLEGRFGATEATVDTEVINAFAAEFREKNKGNGSKWSA